MNYLAQITNTTKALENANKNYRTVDGRQTTLKSVALKEVENAANNQNNAILAAEAAGFTADQINDAIIKGW
jgi:hypothetical protein